MKTYLVLLLSHLAGIGLITLVFNIDRLNIEKYVRDFAIISILVGILDLLAALILALAGKTRNRILGGLVICAGLLFLIGFFSWPPFAFSR